MLREIAAVYRKEMRAYFVSPVPYFVMALFSGYMAYQFFFNESTAFFTPEECRGVPENFLASLPRSGGLYHVSLRGAAPSWAVRRRCLRWARNPSFAIGRRATPSMKWAMHRRSNTFMRRRAACIRRRDCCRI